MEILSKSEIIMRLSEVTGIPRHKNLEFTELEKARKSVGSPSLIIVEDEQGVLHPYIDRGMRFDDPHRSIKAVKFHYKQPRTIHEFGFEVKFVEKTKICEGGGWYSNGGIYEVNGMYFEEQTIWNY